MSYKNIYEQVQQPVPSGVCLPIHSTLFGTSFSLIKTAPKARGWGRECLEFCVLFSVTGSVR